MGNIFRSVIMCVNFAWWFRLDGDENLWVLKVSLSEIFYTHIASQLEPSVRRVQRALCSTLGTRKCCWVHHAWHVEFPVDWRLHDGPSRPRRQSVLVLCPWTTLLLAPVVLGDWKETLSKFFATKCIRREMKSFWVGEEN